MKRKGLVFALVLALSVMAFAPMAVADDNYFDNIYTSVQARMVAFVADDGSDYFIIDYPSYQELTNNDLDVDVYWGVFRDLRGKYFDVYRDIMTRDYRTPLIPGDGSGFYSGTYSNTDGHRFYVKAKYFPAFKAIIKHAVKHRL